MPILENLTNACSRQNKNCHEKIFQNYHIRYNRIRCNWNHWHLTNLTHEPRVEYRVMWNILEVRNCNHKPPFVTICCFAKSQMSFACCDATLVGGRQQSQRLIGFCCGPQQPRREARVTENDDASWTCHDTPFLFSTHSITSSSETLLFAIFGKVTMIPRKIC